MFLLAVIPLDGYLPLVDAAEPAYEFENYASVSTWLVPHEDGFGGEVTALDLAGRTLSLNCAVRIRYPGKMRFRPADIQAPGSVRSWAGKDGERRFLERFMAGVLHTGDPRRMDYQLVLDDLWIGTRDPDLHP